MLLALVLVVLLGLRLDVADDPHVGLLLDALQLVLLLRLETGAGGHRATSVARPTIAVDPVVESVYLGTLLSLDHLDGVLELFSRFVHIVLGLHDGSTDEHLALVLVLLKYIVQFG